MSQIKKLFFKIIKLKVMQNFFIVSIIAVFQLLNNIILGRQLEKSEFGQYSFVFNSLVGLLSILLMFGRNSSLLRYFSSKDFMDYRWKKYIYKDSTLIIFPLVVLMIGIKIVYKLDWFWFWMGMISTYFMCCTNIVSALLRSKQFFVSTLLLERAHPVVLTIILIVLNLIYGPVNKTTASVAKIVSFSVMIPIVFYMLFKWREGKIEIKKNVFKDSLAFWELNISVVVLTSIDAFFIVKILSFEDLALYAVVGSLLQIYEFSRISIFHVFSQKFSKENAINIVSFNKVLLFIIIIIGLFYFFSANFLLDILFNGKYQLSLNLLMLFCIYNSITFLYVLPSCFIIGQSSSKDLRLMLVVNLASIAIKVILIFLLSSFGLSGFLIASIISQLVRTVFGYYMVVKSKNLKWVDLFRLIK